MPLNEPTIVVHPGVRDAGAAAAEQASRTIGAAIAARGRTRVLFASAPSQAPMLAHLRSLDVDWSAVEVFHIDEYVGLAPEDPRGFGPWLRDHLFDHVRPSTVHLIDGASDAAIESVRYGNLLAENDIDLACIGIGVNGHIAFNEPYQWEIDEPALVAPVTLQDESRQQQVDDDCFDSLAEVPTQAISVTVSGILRAHHLIVTVTGAHKQSAVTATLVPGLNPACPATALQSHDSVTIHTDQTAAPATTPAGVA